MAAQSIPTALPNDKSNPDTLPAQPVPSNIPDDKARTIPIQGPFTEREKANILAVNEVWDVAHDLEAAQEHFEEIAQTIAEGRFDAKARYWVAYYIRRLPSICRDNRDRLMQAAQILADANGVRFRASKSGILSGKDGCMCIKRAEATDNAQVVSHV